MSKPQTAIFAASFDPITNGHLDIIIRGSRLSDKLYVALTDNANKKTLFSLEQRYQLLLQAAEILNSQYGINNIEIIINKKLTVELSRHLKVNLLIRGVRNSLDFEYESNLANINKNLSISNSADLNLGSIDAIETVFLACSPQYKVISSSLIRELLSYQQPISQYIHPILAEQIVNYYTDLIHHNQI